MDAEVVNIAVAGEQDKELAIPDKLRVVGRHHPVGQRQVEVGHCQVLEVILGVEEGVAQALEGAKVLAYNAGALEGEDGQGG